MLFSPTTDPSAAASLADDKRQVINSRTRTSRSHCATADRREPTCERSNGSLAELARCKSIHLFCGSLIFEHRAMGDPVAMEQTDTTAQDVYKQMLREHVAPALRELGFGGAPSRGNFRYETATHAAEVRFQKSRYSSKQEVDFWVNLYAVDIKTERVYWDWTLDGLAQLWGDRGEWTIYAGDPNRAGGQPGRAFAAHSRMARDPGRAG